MSRIVVFISALIFTSCASWLPKRSDSVTDKNKRVQDPSSSATNVTVAKEAKNKKSPEEDKRITDRVANAEYHFSMAQAYSTNGNPDRAIEEYKLALVYDPESALIHGRLATEYVKKGLLTEALKEAKHALKLDPEFTDMRLMLAGLYSTAHDDEAALREYDRILKTQPQHEEATVFKSEVLLEQGKTSKALQLLRRYVGRYSDSPLVWYYLGRTEQKVDNFNKAVVAYNKAIELRGQFTQASLSLGYLYETKGMTERAVEVYEDLYDVNQDLGAADRLATIYLKEEKYKLAHRYLEAVTASDPENMNAMVKLGLVQMELKKYQKAIVSFNSILKKYPQSDRIHYYLGSLYEETKQEEKAIVELKKISPESKLFEDAALHIAYLLKKKGRKSAARSFIKESIRKSDKIPSFYIFHASLHESDKRYERAIGVLEPAVKKFPDDEKIRYYLGSLYDRTGNTEKSLHHMETILAKNPDNVDALNYIGYTWTVKGIRLKDAEAMLRKAMKLRPNNGYITDSWGWYLYTTGKNDEAIAQLEKAAQLKPDEAVILEHLGDAYLKSNLAFKAMEQYKNAAKHAQRT